MDDSGLVDGVDGEWLYAAGDVTGRAPLTHQGKYDARIAGAAIAARAAGQPAVHRPWGEHAATADHAAVPQVVFTDPEVAAVGLTEARARDAGRDVRVVDLPIAVGGSTLQADGYDGAARLVVDREREVLIGATFVGQDVAEMVHAATVAVVGRSRWPGSGTPFPLPDDQRGLAPAAGGLPLPALTDRYAAVWVRAAASPSVTAISATSMPAQRSTGSRPACSRCRASPPSPASSTRQPVLASTSQP